MKELKPQTVTVPTIMDESLPADCQSKEDGVCRMGIGKCKQCYPREVQITAFVFSADELRKLFEDAFDAGREFEEHGRGAGNQFKYEDNSEYIKKLLP